MLNYDALQNPMQPNRKGAATSLAQAQEYLEKHPYDTFEENEVLDVSTKYSFFLTNSFFCIVDHHNISPPILRLPLMIFFVPMLTLRLRRRCPMKWQS